MVVFFRIFKIVSVLIVVGFIFNSIPVALFNDFNTVSASTLTGDYFPPNKSTIRGDYNILVRDQGDSDRCELYIDGILVGYMTATTGFYDWWMTVGTYAWSDGWHVVRFDSKGGATGNDSKAIYLRFDNNPPSVTDVQVLYPTGQTACKPGDTITITAKVSESTTGIGRVVCDGSYFGNIAEQTMYDDGNHYDGFSGDGIYGTPPMLVTNDLVGYHPIYVNATDGAGNFYAGPGEVGIDNIDPIIKDVTVIYPEGQYSAKDSDKIRVTAYVDDEIPDVDIVLDIDRSGSMGWTQDSAWSFQDIDISHLVDTKNQVQIRFSYETDIRNLFSGWNIDNLRLVSSQSKSGFFISDFETATGNNNWTLSGGEWELSQSPLGLGGEIGIWQHDNPDPTNAYQGSRIMGVDITGDGNYENNVNTATATSPVINAASHNDVHLTFYRWLNCDFPGTAPDYDPFKNSGDEHLIQVKNSTSGNWTTVWDNKQQKLVDAKEASKILINLLGDNDQSALYSFGGTVSQDQAWTYNKTEMFSAIDNLSAGGGTALWSSIVQAANYAGTSETLKALVVLSDGQNTVGGSKRAAIEAIQNNEVPTFTIGLGTKDAEDDLIDIANAYPGGSYYYAASSDDLIEIYEDISHSVGKIRFPHGAKYIYVNATPLGGISRVLM
jgi:hypothetical protein